MKQWTLKIKIENPSDGLLKLFGKQRCKWTIWTYYMAKKAINQ